MDAIRKEINDESTDFRSLLKRIKGLRGAFSKNLVPYATKDDCVKELEVLDKKALLQIRVADRELISTELNSVLQKVNETKAPYIVHIFRPAKPIEFVLLWEARMQCNELPAMLIAVTDSKFIAAVSVPAQYVTENVDAGDWIQQLGDSVSRKCGRPKIKDNCSICNSRSYKYVSHDFDWNEAVDRATKYAEKMFVRK